MERHVRLFMENNRSDEMAKKPVLSLSLTDTAKFRHKERTHSTEMVEWFSLFFISRI